MTSWLKLYRTTLRATARRHLCAGFTPMIVRGLVYRDAVRWGVAAEVVDAAVDEALAEREETDGHPSR